MKCTMRRVHFPREKRGPINRLNRWRRRDTATSVYMPTGIKAHAEVTRRSRKEAKNRLRVSYYRDNKKNSLKISTTLRTHY